MKNLVIVVLTLILSSCGVPQFDIFSVKTNAEEKDYQRSINIAKIARDSNNPVAAIDIYGTLLKKYPKDDEVKFALSQTYFHAGMGREALKILSDLETDDPENPNILVGLGRANLSLYRPAIAEGYFEKAMQIEPTNRLALIGMAVSKDILGQHSEARSVFNRLLLENPNDLQILNNLAVSYLLEGDYEEAVTRLQDIAFEPGSSLQVRQNLALALGLLGNRQEAERISLLDLSAEAVANNLRFYELLRLSGNPLNVQQLLLGPRSDSFLRKGG